MDTQTSETITIIAMIGAAAFIIWLIFRRYQSAAQLRLRSMETFNRLLDRFQATDELVAFLDGEHGRRLFGDMTSLARPSDNGFRVYAILGVLLLAFGIAHVINAARLASHIVSTSDPNVVHKLADMQDWATVLLSFAVALIGIAVVGNYLMRRRLLADRPLARTDAR